MDLQRHRKRELIADTAHGAAFAGEQVASVRQRQEILCPALDDAQTTIAKPQIADDLRLQQADRVGGGGVAEAGVEFLGNGGAADDAAPLNDAHAQAGHGKVGCTRQPIMARSNDNGVEVGHGLRKMGEVLRPSNTACASPSHELRRNRPQVLHAIPCSPSFVRHWPRIKASWLPRRDRSYRRFYIRLAIQQLHGSCP